MRHSEDILLTQYNLPLIEHGTQEKRMKNFFKKVFTSRNGVAPLIEMSQN